MSIATNINRDETTAQIAGSAPRVSARVAGLAYAVTILMGMLAVVVRGKIVVVGDAGATASNILAHESLYRFAFTTDLIAISAYVAVTLFLYHLFLPAGRSVSLLAAFFSLVGCAVGAVSCLFHLASLVALKETPYLGVFNTEQLRALVLLLLRLRGISYSIGLVFFGFYCLLIGYLVFKSHFASRIVGGLMVLSGLSWLTFLHPPLASYIAPYNLVIGLFGEASLTMWLLVMGVNEPSVTPG